MNVWKIDQHSIWTPREHLLARRLSTNGCHWFSFWEWGRVLSQQCYNGGRVQELVRARAPPGMSHPPPPLPLNSPDQTPHIRPTFVQTDQYFKPNQYLQYFQDNFVQYMAIISTQMIISTVDQLFQGNSLCLGEEHIWHVYIAHCSVHREWKLVLHNHNETNQTRTSWDIGKLCHNIIVAFVWLLHELPWVVLSGVNDLVVILRDCSALEWAWSQRAGEVYG